jgi:vacuolar-type H+-ATPase subunit F/Vma7
MSKIAFIGPKYLAAPLSAAGIDTFSCDSAQQGHNIFTTILGQKEHAIVFITERTALELKENIGEAEKQGINVVLLPDHRGTTGAAREELQNLIRRATGAAS